MAKKFHLTVFQNSQNGPTCILTTQDGEFRGKYFLISNETNPEKIFLVGRTDGSSILCWVKDDILRSRFCDKVLSFEERVYYFVNYRWYWWKSYDEQPERCLPRKSAELEKVLAELHETTDYALTPINKHGRPQAGTPVEGQLCKLTVGKNILTGRYCTVKSGSIFSLKGDNVTWLCWLKEGQLWYQKCQQYLLLGDNLYIYYRDKYFLVEYGKVRPCNKEESERIAILFKQQ